MKSKRTREFRLLYDDLPSSIQRQADKTYLQFHHNRNHMSLHFKPVGGDPVWYSVRVGFSYRAVCIIADVGTYVWFWIGSHADYDKLLSQR